MDGFFYSFDDVVDEVWWAKSGARFPVSVIM